MCLFPSLETHVLHVTVSLMPGNQCFMPRDLLVSVQVLANSVIVPLLFDFFNFKKPFSFPFILNCTASALLMLPLRILGLLIEVCFICSEKRLFWDRWVGPRSRLRRIPLNGFVRAVPEGWSLAAALIVPAAWQFVLPSDDKLVLDVVLSVSTVISFEMSLALLVRLMLLSLPHDNFFWCFFFFFFCFTTSQCWCWIYLFLKYLCYKQAVMCYWLNWWRDL